VVDVPRGPADQPACDQAQRELFREITSVEYRLFNGQVRVLEKDEIIKLVGNSPNEPDAAVYGNFVRTRSVELPPETPKTTNTAATRAAITRR
jgi:hypothetical protein